MEVSTFTTSPAMSPPSEDGTTSVEVAHPPMMPTSVVSIQTPSLAPPPPPSSSFEDNESSRSSSSDNTPTLPPIGPVATSIDSSNMVTPELTTKQPMLLACHRCQPQLLRQPTQVMLQQQQQSRPEIAPAAVSTASTAKPVALPTIPDFSAPGVIEKRVSTATCHSIMSSSSSTAPAAVGTSCAPGIPAPAFRLNKFVRRLYEMLMFEKGGGIVEWRRGLLVLYSTKAFTKQILPRWFLGTSNFKTFRRQLNYYGFVHVRSFSATGSSTTALWINQELARDEANDDISAVLKLRRVEPNDAAKTVEGRRLRKEQALYTVEEDIGLSSKELQLDQIRTMAIRGEDFGGGDAMLQKPPVPVLPSSFLPTVAVSSVERAVSMGSHDHQVQDQQGQHQSQACGIPLEVHIPSNETNVQSGHDGDDDKREMMKDDFGAAANMLLLLARSS